MNKPFHVYVACPYSSDPANGVRRSSQVAARILDQGFIPFVPLLNHFWHMITPRDYDVWMEWCLAWVARCDALVRLAGPSPGADREVAEAQRLGIPVYFMDWGDQATGLISSLSGFRSERSRAV